MKKLIIGKTDTGKTRGVLFKDTIKSIENNENLLFLDNKQEYYRTFAKTLKEKDYNVLVLNLKDSTKSNGYNPLYLPYKLYKEGDIDTAIELVEKLSLELFKSDSLTADPFWENSASSYFTAMALTLFKEGKVEEINLGSVSMMINQSNQKVGETTLFNKYLETLDPLDKIYVSASTTAFAPTETKGSILSVIKDKITLFLMKESLLNVLCTNEIKLDELKNKTAIFIIGKEGSYNNIANIFIDQLVNISLDNNVKFSFYLDNFESYSRILELNNLLEMATINELNVYVAIKSIEELENKYGKHIVTRFNEVIKNVVVDELVDVLDYNMYPVLELKNHKYFNLEEFLII
ncbi:MAG: hypothetical protein E7157_05695 [Lactobacillales bacterium]|nr:hypothetical protein [Lactobacillales bacterium]